MNTPIDNPWTRTPRSPPFELAADADQLRTFNSRFRKRDPLRTHLLPIPFLGSPSAPVVLLNLNPGYCQLDDKLQKTPRFMRACRKCLLHKDSVYPFFFLDPHIEGGDDGGGHYWWSRILKPLLVHFKNDGARFLATRLFCVEYFPYRSQTFGHLGNILDSQRYGFKLVHLAIQRRADIILMRARERWLDAVPELAGYSRLYTLKNPRNPVISERNMPDAFRRVIRTLEHSRTAS